MQGEDGDFLLKRFKFPIRLSLVFLSFSFTGARISALKPSPNVNVDSARLLYFEYCLAIGQVLLRPKSIKQRRFLRISMSHVSGTLKRAI